MGNSALAQVKVEGQVLHLGEPIDNVTIKILESGEVQRTLLADRRGKFESEFGFNRSYTLVFVRPFMLPVAIDVNTKNEGGKIQFYEVPLKMRMYHRFAGMSKKEARQSIGVIAKTGQGEDAFSFQPYPKVIEELRPIYAESERREKAGEGPIASEVFFPEPAEAKVMEKTTEEEEVTKESVAKAEEVKEERAIERFELIEEARKEERGRMFEAKDQEVNAASKVEREGSSYIDRSKEIRREMELADQQRRDDLTAARIEKHAQHEQELQAVAGGMPSPLVPATGRRLVKHTVDEGTFMSEERFIVEDRGVVFEYRKATYNWLLFDVTYYSKDDEEISEEEYEHVRITMGI